MALTFTFAGDEAGDVSFNFGKGASRYFVMAVIGTTEPVHLRQTLADVREELRLPAAYEFSFNDYLLRDCANVHLRLFDGQILKRVR